MKPYTHSGNTKSKPKTENKWPVSCKNCGEVFIGNFCPECGQHKKSLERPINEFLLDFLGNLFAFDTRFINSLRSVIFRPGQMIKEYVGGKSIRYMPPFRLYIFVSFVFFLLLSIVSNRSIEKNKVNIKIEINALNDTIEENFETAEQIADSVLTGQTTNPTTISTSFEEESNALLRQRIADFRNNPKAFISIFLRYLNWTLFVLMPLLGLLLWGAFREIAPLYIVHFIFAINQHIVFFLLMIGILLIGIILPNKTISPEYYLLLMMPIHIIIGARQLYGTKIHSTVFRIIIIESIYLLIVFSITTALLLFTMFYGKP